MCDGTRNSVEEKGRTSFRKDKGGGGARWSVLNIFGGCGRVVGCGGGMGWGKWSVYMNRMKQG